jgi:hypothetical protein
MNRFSVRSLAGPFRNVSRVVLAAAVLELATPAERTEAVPLIDIIAVRGQAAPDGDGTLSGFLGAALNASGQVAISADLTGTTRSRGIFIGSGGALTQIARRGDAAPTGPGTLLTINAPRINAAGQAAFFTTLTGAGVTASNDRAIYRGSGPGTLVEMAREGNPAPGFGGTLSTILTNPSINTSGQVGFNATQGPFGAIMRGAGGALTQIASQNQVTSFGILGQVTQGDPVLNDAGEMAFPATITLPAASSGIFRGSGGTLTRIARSGDAAPAGPGTLTGFPFRPRINASGQVAFQAQLGGPGVTASNDMGVFLGSGGALTQIAREGDAAPVGPGVLNRLDGINATALNNAGHVAFQADLTGPGVTLNNFRGIYRGSGGTLTQIYRAGNASPDGNGVFGASDIVNPYINSAGVVAFRPDLRATIGGGADDRGFFLGDGQEIVQLLREGQALLGSTITALTANVAGSEVGGQSPFNDAGQLAGLATLADGRTAIFLATPELHWRAAGNGSWDTAASWTLGLSPDNPHPIVIDPAVNLTVFGPGAAETVKSLQVGGGTGTATLSLGAGSIAATDGVNVRSTGVLLGAGVIDADVTSFGKLAPGSSAGLMGITGDLTLGAGSSTEIELAGLLRGTQYDAIDVGGDLSIAGNLTVQLMDGFTLEAGESFEIFDVAGLLSGSFAGLPEGAAVGTFGGSDLFITYAGGDGNDVVLFAAQGPTGVPAPGTLALLALGITGLASHRQAMRRRTRE